MNRREEREVLGEVAGGARCSGWLEGVKRRMKGGGVSGGVLVY